MFCGQESGSNGAEHDSELGEAGPVEPHLIPGMQTGDVSAGTGGTAGCCMIKTYEDGERGAELTGSSGARG